MKKSSAQDWAYLRRYADDNTKLGLPAKGENRIVFMGDSITEGWKTIDPDFFTGKPYINRGINGQTTAQMLLRFRADVINLKPALAIILAGTNDIAGNTGPATLQMIMDNIISMAELAQANRCKVILCSVLPASDYPWSPGMEPANKIVLLNDMIAGYAKNNLIAYIDYHKEMADNCKSLNSNYSEDGVHPNKVGYQIMARLLEIAIIKFKETI